MFCSATRKCVYSSGARKRHGFDISCLHLQIGIAQREFLISKQTTTRIIDLYLGKASPVAKVRLTRASERCTPWR